MITLRQGLSYLGRHILYDVFKISKTDCIIRKISMVSHKISDYIVWIDMEMTGLDPEKDKILELACLITDANLKTVSDEFEVVIHQSDEALNGMDSWCTSQHTKTGLINASRISTITNSEAESRLLEFLKKYVPKGTCPLGGNTVYMDRFFLLKQMPLISDYLHYRIIDVSTIKELMRRWNADLHSETPSKRYNHRALGDIRESISELEFYREHMFK